MHVGMVAEGRGSIPLIGNLFLRFLDPILSFLSFRLVFCLVNIEASPSIISD